MATSTHAHAAAPSPLPLLSQALNGVARYQVDLTIRGASTGTITGTVVVVRKDGKNQAHVTLTTPAGSGATTTVDAVVAGARVCVKQAAGQPYQCITSPTVAAQINLDPSSTFQRAGVSTHFTPAGTKVVLGKLCTGYAFTLTSTSVRAHGTLYLNATNGRPREEDVTTTATTAATATTPAKTVTATTTALWSRYDDPTLTIPAVPAS